MALKACWHDTITIAISLSQLMGCMELNVRVCSHQAIVAAKAKAIKGQAKKSKNKQQTSKKIFAFARSEHSVSVHSI